ncbi:Tetratricopeptide repeat (TPR)-like superfamily protein [Raphanus sativus]|uniref:Protein SLOW GREEN 1, chloroplastic n=1 Tax=Raphanus sativus TaxID=3726 RepID=A0A6J0MLJ8_RAPSA|nr:protein SLOW GREEN 1, chloroplastic [Raphanus sativus]KAJ4908892.1 Tetratricopeptide repeat (TPR)-like superfamily protein [Raphanus sativus]
MASLAKFHCSNQPFHLKLNNGQSRFQPKPTSYRIHQKPPPSRAIRASSSSKPKPSLLKTTCVTLTTAAALLSASLHLSSVKPAVAAPPIAPTASEASSSIETDQEAALEKHLAANPNDLEALQSLMKIKLQSKNLDQSVEILNRLISLDPEEQEWRILKAQVQTYGGDFDSATKGFEEVLAKDPLRVEAYHGLVMAYSESESKLSELEGRIGEAIERCKKEDRKKDFRDFMLLIAQIRVMEGNPSEALRVYQELVKDEPRDFRPYLCQGLIYTLLKKKDEAEKQFEQFRKLVPENHPYKEYFDSNMLNTNKLFAKS